jgi:NHL repeat-containing protein
VVISDEALLVAILHHQQICKDFMGLNEEIGVVVDSSGNVYVSDTNNNLVQAVPPSYLLSISIYASTKIIVTHLLLT